VKGDEPVCKAERVSGNASRTSHTDGRAIDEKTRGPFQSLTRGSPSVLLGQRSILAGGGVASLGEGKRLLRARRKGAFH